MRISPIDIQQKQFKTRPFGYEKAGVDQFLEILAEEMERLLRQCQDATEELSLVKASLAEMKEREATLKETLITTQKVTDELRATARKEVEVILAEAELKAERVVRNAEERRIQLIQEIQEIKSQKIDFETSLRALLEKHIRLIDMNVVAIEQADEESKLLEEPLPFEREDAVESGLQESAGAGQEGPPGPDAASAAGDPDRQDRSVDQDIDLAFDFDDDQDNVDEGFSK